MWNLKTNEKTSLKKDQTCGYQRRRVEGEGELEKGGKRYKLPVTR